MSGKRSPEEFKIGALVDNRKQSGGYIGVVFMWVSTDVTSEWRPTAARQHPIAIFDQRENYSH